MKKNKIFINLKDVVSEITTFIKMHPRISRKKKPHDVTHSPMIKHTVHLSPMKRVKSPNNL